MQIDPKLKAKLSQKPKKDTHLHSADHVLADELSRKFGEPRRFGFYLKMATTHSHSVLRRIAGEVGESGKAKKPGALFAFLVKKENNGPAN
jgi:hypothetical protein